MALRRLARNALRAAVVPRHVSSRLATSTSSRLATSTSTSTLLLRPARHSSSAAALASEDTSAVAPEDTSDVAPETPAEPTPMRFAALAGKISDKTLQALTGSPFNLRHMTPVQEEVLSLLPDIARPPTSPDQTRDLLVRAKTGTGKTLAFLLPAVEARLYDIEQQPEEDQKKYAKDTVGTLIVSPTRELALQIAAEAQRLTSRSKGFQVSVFVGGNSKRDQMRQWKNNRRDIVVATPGRLRDLMNSEPDVAQGLKTAKMMILDEVDTMLDIGFREDMEEVKRQLGSGTEQTFLFSATVSPKIQQVAAKFLAPGYKYINTVVEEDSPVHAHIPQYSTLLPSAADQLPTVLKLIAHDQLSNPTMSKIIIFLPTTRMVQLYTTLIRQMGKYGGAGTGVVPAGRQTDVLEIHSKKSQEARTSASSKFRANRSGASILVTSDVSARGVDYPGVTRVIQVGIPSSADQYIHRVGRTGRGSATGVGRGDLVLLPWEVGFLTWQLAAVPLKSITVKDIAEQTAELAREFDLGLEKSPAHLINRPYLPILEELDNSVSDLHTKLDQEAIRDTFMSQLGFYFGNTDALRVSKDAILDGLKAWTTEGFGMESAPYVSQEFLKKIGMNGGGSRGKRSDYGSREPRGDFGGRREAFGGRSEFGGRSDFGGRRERESDFGGGRRESREQPPWMGRGRTQQRREGGYEERFQGGSSSDRRSGGRREGGYRGRSEEGGSRWGNDGGERPRRAFRERSD